MSYKYKFNLNDKVETPDGEGVIKGIHFGPWGVCLDLGTNFRYKDQPPQATLESIAAEQGRQYEVCIKELDKTVTATYRIHDQVKDINREVKKIQKRLNEISGRQE